MDERSFQGLPPVFGSHRILFQVPVVVSGKICIPPALVAFFHYANVLVKALNPLFTETAVWLTFMSLVDGNSSVALQFPSRIPHSADFPGSLYLLSQWLPGDSSVSLSASSDIGSFMSSLIWGLSNIPALSFSLHICENFQWKANPLIFLFITFIKFFIAPNVICKGGKSILFGSTRGWDWTLCESIFNTRLNGHSCLT